MQNWLVYTLAAMSLILLGFSTYAVMMDNNTVKQTLQKVPAKKPTFYDYRQCLNSCSKICAGTDAACRTASTKFQNCFSKDAGCQKWWTEQSQLSSTSPIPDEFYNCFDSCAPDTTTSYYGIYKCNVECAGETEHPKLESADIPTFFEYEDCSTKKCRGQCDKADHACLLDSYNYNTCYGTKSTCQAWNMDQAQLQSDSPMPDDFFACDKDCRPGKTSKYFDLYMCKATCGGAKAAKLEANRIPTFFEYEDCATKKCRTQCDKSDKQCLLDSFNYQTCYASKSTCAAWNMDQAQLQSDSPMPDDFFACDKDCRPGKTSKYFDMYMCKATCGGAM